ncbi:uncharacterized protein L3040_005475 [Drepanopeziza brunnea f. sp. 'multigermtubi']|uniref:uncharacterized protein n=1 Tax=Drepanopeziza brunnea f. sp. 'multigermtubi' TaxID=698441 RepID=UPI00238ADCC6|nr:hypothetical protein L3040_005475 [Drepanopeziza brunnea f. sp. 'multigermtubi']
MLRRVEEVTRTAVSLGPVGGHVHAGPRTPTFALTVLSPASVEGGMGIANIACMPGVTVIESEKKSWSCLHKTMGFLPS